jgi:hypothetical protein
MTMISEKKYNELIKFNETRLHSIKSLLIIDLKKAGYIEQAGKRIKQDNDTLSTYRLTEFARSLIAKYESSLQDMKPAASPVDTTPADLPEVKMAVCCECGRVYPAHFSDFDDRCIVCLALQGYHDHLIARFEDGQDDGLDEEYDFQPPILNRVQFNHCPF